jgi:tetraacyldisaccharide 4'-kinase
MREPYFWRDLPRFSRASAPMMRLLLTPFAAAYSWVGKSRIERTKPEDAGIPVVCIGNLTLGGAGKTPVAAAVRRWFEAKERRAASLSRGYRGSEQGPLRVDPARHTVTDVGDEPLMLAALGEAWVSKDRVAGAKAMKADGVEFVVMDDGHQNPTLKKTLSIVGIDAAAPFGSRHIFPKGPLREPVARGLARADAVILMGEGEQPPELAGFDGPVLRAGLEPLAVLPAGKYVAFAGIGRPERFFDGLQAMNGVALEEAVPYPDHHVFEKSDLGFLTKLAAERDAQLVTTDKDHVRLPPELKPKIVRASVEARFEDESALAALLTRVLP